MRFLLFLATLSASCAHTPEFRADISALPPRKDDGPRIAALSRHVVFRADVDEDSVALFAQQLNAHIQAGESSVVVEIDTPGGSVSAGMEMARAIERSPVPVVCVVDGMAASMGLYILQSCDVRLMTSRSLLMGHEPAAMARGRPGELRDLASLLAKLSRAMAHHIVAKTALSVEAYLEKIDGKELWLDVDEAVALKFVDFSAQSVSEVLESTGH